MTITFNIKQRDRSLDFEGGLQVNWEPELQELRNFAYHGFYFTPGWNEQTIEAYANTNALDSLYSAINYFFPNQYQKGSFV